MEVGEREPPVALPLTGAITMFKSARVLLLVAASLAGVTIASAAVLYDDFTTKWRNLQIGSGTALTMVRNRVEISLAANSKGAGADFFSRGLASTCVLSGNFDLRVSYRLLNWPNGNGVRTALYLGDPTKISDESQGMFIERDSYSVADGGPREVYVFFAGGDIVQEIDTAHTSGQLRVTRNGSRVNGYYRQGTSWVSLMSIDLGTQQDVQFMVLLYSHDSVFADMRASAAFDNVSVVTGVLKGAACPYAT